MKKIILAGMMLIASACSTWSTSSSSERFALKPFEEETMQNGLRILWIQDTSLPRVSLNMMVDVGSLDEESSLEGLNAFTAGMMSKGTARHTAPQLAEAMEQIGAEFAPGGAPDFTTLTASGLSPSRSELLSLFAEIVLTPSFQVGEIERHRSNVLSQIQKNQDQPTAYADERLNREIFGTHPYGSSTLGALKTVKNFHRADIIRHYYAYYRPNNSILAVVGNFDDSFRQEVRRTFQGWTKADVKRLAHKPAADRPSRVVLVNKTGLQQTQIRMGHLGIPRNSADFMTLRLANVILGGAFASRLNQKIRDDLGLTYSINSGSDARLEPGSFEISTFTRHEKTADTILETRKLVDEFVQAGVTDEELQAAKALLVGQFPASLETADRLAFNLMVLRRYGISDNYLKNFQSNVKKVTKDQVNASIRKNLHPDHLQIVIYSDEKALSDQLGRLGPIEKSKVE